MNIFGAFSFGSLIKTFLPGFVWLVAIISAFVDLHIARHLALGPLISFLVGNNGPGTLFLALPISILLGLISNIVVFMGLNDWLVRKPVRLKHPDLFALYDHLAFKVREGSWSGIKLPDQSLRCHFVQYADPELIMLPVIGLDKLSHTREQYWYHLEFQINLILSAIGIFAAIVLHLLFASQSDENFITVLFKIFLLSLFFATLCFELCLAARKNYRRHIEKVLSLMAISLKEELKEKPTQSFRSRLNRVG